MKQHSTKLIYTRRAFRGKQYQLVSVVQEGDLWQMLERLRSEDIEVVTVEDSGWVYYAVYTLRTEGMREVHGRP